VSKNESVESDITKNTKKKSKKTTEKDTIAQNWTRNCPNCQKELTYKYKQSRDNSEKFYRWCWSCRNSGKGNPFYGKSHTDEHKLYMSETTSNRDQELVKRIAEKNRGKVMSKRVRDKLREKSKIQFSTPESRKLASERTKLAHQRDPSIRETLRRKAIEQHDRYKQTDEYQHWLSKKSEYELYRMEVLRLTFENDLTVLDNWSKRNLYHKYEVDHIYPIRQAFKRDIPSNLIGDIRNLRIIPRKENRSKSGKVTIIPEHIQVYLKEVTINEQNIPSVHPTRHQHQSISSTARR
jgi:hypothetical protein